MRYAIGIQIEEYAFRYFVDAPDLATDTFSGKPQDVKVFNALVDKGWFIDKKSGSKFHGRTLVSTGEPCNKYEPDFIYQHYDLGENMGYAEVRSEICRAFTSKAFNNSFEITKNLSEKN